MSNQSRDVETREPHCLISRSITRRGRNGLPESHREIECCKERHAEWFALHGWRVLIRDSDMPVDPHDIDPAQSNPRRDNADDGGD
jgi:hypothetical protein